MKGELIHWSNPNREVTLDSASFWSSITGEEETHEVDSEEAIVDYF